MPIKPLAAVLALGAVFVLPQSTAATVADVPGPVTLTNTVRVPALGGQADGTATMVVDYTGTTASATARTGNTVGLGSGFYFKLTTCVNWHRDGHTPLAYCADRYVDTRSNTGVITTYAPKVTLPDRPRPSGTDRWAYFDSYVEVTYQSGSAYLMAAHSWPDNGLRGAAVAVPPVGQTTGVLPPNQTTGVDGGFTGAIDTGQPDSICRPQVAEGSGPLPAGVTNNHPAFAGAPAYYEVGRPTGAFTDKAPLGAMLIINGGGWVGVGPLAVQGDRVMADRFRNLGWETVNITYRGCGKSLVDALWFHDKARSWFGSKAALCTSGGSAGGHLALMVAAQRPGVYCAVSLSGPTDLTTLPTQRAYNPTTGKVDQTNGGRWVHNLGAAAFGVENLSAFSPVTQVSPSLVTTRVLQASGYTDPLVSYDQAIELQSAILAAKPSAFVQNLRLPAGSAPFVHTTVSEAGLNDYLARERAIIAPITSPTIPLNRR